MPTEHSLEVDAVWNELSAAIRNSIMQAGLAAKEVAEFGERRRWLQIGQGFSAIRLAAQRRAVTSNIQHPTYRYYHRLILSKVPDLEALEKRDHASCHH